MENMDLYKKFKTVPPEAKKPIVGGRLKGMTDINPMWRLKVLTEQFGPCGIGWKYTIDKQWIEKSPNGEEAAFVNISLYFKYNGEWSDAIPGTGGSSFVANESRGPYMSDECFKMALTDAIGVACKSLGIAADVYFEKDRSKYDNTEPQNTPQQTQNNQQQNTPKETKPISEAQLTRLYTIASKKGSSKNQVIAATLSHFKISDINNLTKPQYDEVVKIYEAKPDKQKE